MKASYLALQPPCARKHTSPCHTTSGTTGVFWKCPIHAKNIRKFNSFATRENGPRDLFPTPFRNKEAGKTARFFAVTPKKEEI
jgi:hypothetical protein